MMTETLTLTDFLLPRLAEDEAVARAGISGQADPENGWGYIQAGVSRGALTPHVGIIHEPAQAAHIIRWHPARVLAEVEAKRRILAEHPAPSYIGTPGARLACGRCSDLGGPYGYDDPANWVDWPCPTLRALASVYADHPDYREEWRP